MLQAAPIELIPLPGQRSCAYDGASSSAVEVLLLCQTDRNIERLV